MKIDFIEISIDAIAREYDYLNKDFDPIKYDALQVSIKKLGQILPLIVFKKNDKYILIDGAMRLKIFKDNNFKKIHISVIQGIPENVAKILRLYFNTVQMELNYLAMASFLSDYKKEGLPWDLLKILPLTSEQIDNLSNLVDFDWRDTSIGKTKNVSLKIDSFFGGR